MGRKNILEAYRLETAKTLASSFNSGVVNVKTVDNVGINISTSGVTDNTGSFAIEHRVYKDDNNASDWATLTLSATPTLSDTDDTFFLNMNQLPPGQVRIAFTAAGGTPDGTCDIWVTGCMVGG